jgi:hypothetical protein
MSRPPVLTNRLLQAGQRPDGDPHRQRQPPPEVPEVISNQAQPQPDLVGAKAVAAKPRQRDRLLAFLYPLLGRAPLVVEAHHCPVVERQVGHDKADAGKQFPAMEFDFRHYSPGHRPTRRLIEKTFESKHRLVARPSHWPRQQLRNVPLQIVIGRKADRVLHVAFFQRLIELRLGKGRVAAEGHFFALRLLPLDLGQQQFFSAVGAVDVATHNSSGSAPGVDPKKPSSRWPPQSFPSPIIACAIRCRTAIWEHSILPAPMRSAPRSAWRAASRSSATKSRFAKPLKRRSFLVAKLRDDGAAHHARNRNGV